VSTALLFRLVELLFTRLDRGTVFILVILFCLGDTSVVLSTSTNMPITELDTKGV